MLITVIGRGHSGTRAMSHTLSASGVFMGAQQNESGDLVPPGDMYEACRVMARHVRYLGNMKWDFERLHTMKIDAKFEELLGSYLESVLSSDEPRKGWKIPETVLLYPWLVRMFPNIHYIFWVRDPRDSILGGHLTDDLSDFGVPYDRTDDIRERRAISWKYQSDIYNSTPRPANLLEVRFEDFVLRQDEALARLEQYLGFPMAKIEVRPESVGRWKTADGQYNFPCFQEELEKYGYV
jgi:hypothetical protein